MAKICEMFIYKDHGSQIACRGRLAYILSLGVCAEGETRLFFEDIVNERAICLNFGHKLLEVRDAARAAFGLF